ncbi:Snf7-domain-containing protein [Powellomyces hirtus]|nr:Snf7-domain-containing protein [Powellomyces hirtus]
MTTLSSSQMPQQQQQFSSLDAYLATLPGWTGTDERSNHLIHSLFRSFTDLSPAAHAEKITFWRNVISEAASRRLLGDHMSAFDAKGLESKFKRRGLAPLGLDVVVSDMIRTQDLVPLAQYRNEIGWGSWAVSTLVKAPLSWGYAQVTGKKSKSTALENQYVVAETVKREADAFLSEFYQEGHYGVDHVLRVEDFKSRLADACAAQLNGTRPSKLDIDLVQTYLKASGKAVFSVDPNHPDDGIVKVRPAQDKSSSTLIITETDRGIIKLRRTVHMLHLQVEELETRIFNLTKQAKDRVRVGQKERALYFIRQKKGVTELLKKRIASLETIEGIIGKIEGAESESEVLAAYQLGSSSLASFMSTSGLTADAVDATMDKLQETLADQAEINDAIESGQNAIIGSTVDTDEIEEELEQLLEEERAVSWPAVPTAPLPSEAIPSAGKNASATTNYAALDAELDDMLSEEMNQSSKRKASAQPLGA